MKRSALGMLEVTAHDNLQRAFHRAAASARRSREATAFGADLERELAVMREQLRAGTFAFGAFHAFEIWDPKRRVIHAPCFRERVAHHALMAVAGPVLDRALVDDTFACRKHKGALAAVLRAQHHLRRHAYYVKVDVARYFDSVDQAVLRASLARRLKSPELLASCSRVLAAYCTLPGKGLPIGALTSQHFANYYLAPLDRFLLERLRARALVRYMDDVVWWCDTKEEARASLAQVREFLAQVLLLRLKHNVVVGRSEQGLSLCGFRIRRGQLRLSRRRQRRFVLGRARWERMYRMGFIDGRGLQRGFDAVLATTAHADARSWRREQLARRPGLSEA